MYLQKTLFLLLFLLFVAITIKAEENQEESPFSASLELSTKYMWRGIESIVR